MPSPSESLCSVFAMFGQLSHTLRTLSPSESNTAHVAPSMNSSQEVAGTLSTHAQFVRHAPVGTGGGLGGGGLGGGGGEGGGGLGGGLGGGGEGAVARQ